MGEYLNASCESHVTVESKAIMEEEEAQLSKKRKLYSELEHVYSGHVEDSVSQNSGCSKHEDDVVQRSFMRSPDLKSVELEESEGLETENSTSVNGFFSRETTPTSELCGDSEQEVMEPQSVSKRKPASRPRRKVKMPSEEELEEFFAAAEKCEAERFAERYNYDIVKDVPLEGRYQWVRLLP